MGRDSHLKVVEHVETALRGGELRVGDRLPAERALAADLGISRASLREGLRVLQAMGVLRPGTGRGPLAGTVVVADMSAAFTGALRIHVASARLPVPDVVRTRTVLESWTVAEAARRGQPQPLRQARLLFEAMAVPRIEQEEFYSLDAQFHLALAEAAGNQVIIAIMASLRESIEAYVRAGSRAAGEGWASLRRRLRAQHQGVLEAVDAGDAALASRRVVAHIEDFYRRTNVTS
jgi:GntR family transcriptional repressor for pyruvate dehydrogenase complex